MTSPCYELLVKQNHELGSILYTLPSWLSHKKHLSSPVSLLGSTACLGTRKYWQLQENIVGLQKKNHSHIIYSQSFWITPCCKRNMMVFPQPTHLTEETASTGCSPSSTEDEVPEELLAPWEGRGWTRPSDALRNNKSFLQPLQTAQIIRTQHIKDILVWSVSPACTTTNRTFAHL